MLKSAVRKVKLMNKVSKAISLIEVITKDKEMQKTTNVMFLPDKDYDLVTN